MPAYGRFAASAAAVSFPPWFYAAWQIGGLTPLVKKALTEEEVARGEHVDARPIVGGEVDLRAILSNLMWMVSASLCRTSSGLSRWLSVCVVVSPISFTA